MEQWVASRAISVIKKTDCPRDGQVACAKSYTNKRLMVEASLFLIKAVCICSRGFTSHTFLADIEGVCMTRREMKLPSSK